MRKKTLARREAKVTARTGIPVPDIDYSTECGARCKHAGICSLPPGHEGKHDASGYCQWTNGG